MYSHTYLKYFRHGSFIPLSKHIFLSLYNNSLIIFHPVNYVCLVSVVLWYFLIGPLANISSGITGTDTQNVMIALADWLQELFSTNPISTWKHFPAPMEYDEDSVSPYCCSRPRHHGILRNDDTHHSTTPTIGCTALPFMVGPAN